LQTFAPQKEYPDVTIRRLWEPKVEKAPVAEAVEAPMESEVEPASVFKAA